LDLKSSRSLKRQWGIFGNVLICWQAINVTMTALSLKAAFAKNRPTADDANRLHQIVHLRLSCEKDPTAKCGRYAELYARVRF
jgi:hypothetical protein